MLKNIIVTVSLILAAIAIGQVPPVNSGTAIYPTNGTISSSPVYDNGGTLKPSAHMVIGSSNLSLGSVTITLSGDSVYTSTTSYVCSATDTSGAASVTSTQNQSASQFRIFGTVNNSVSYSCIGN